MHESVATYFHSLPLTLTYTPSFSPQGDKIVSLTTAAGCPVEPIWATLLAKALDGKNVKDMLTNVGSGAGGAAIAAAPAAGGAAAGGAPAEEKKEEKKEEEKEESDGEWIAHAFIEVSRLTFALRPQTTWDSVCSTKPALSASHFSIHHLAPTSCNMATVMSSAVVSGPCAC